MCPHANTTTIAFLYGEAPLAHAAHVAGCADCSAVAESHEQVVAALGPALAAVRPRLQAPRSPHRQLGRPRTLAALAAAAATVAVVCTTARGPTRPLAEDPDASLDVVELEIAALGWEE